MSVWLLKQDGLGDAEGAGLRGSVATTWENDCAWVVHSECLAKHRAISILKLSEVFLLLPVAFLSVEWEEVGVDVGITFAVRVSTRVDIKPLTIAYKWGAHARTRHVIFVFDEYTWVLLPVRCLQVEEEDLVLDFELSCGQVLAETAEDRKQILFNHCCISHVCQRLDHVLAAHLDFLPLHGCQVQCEELIWDFLVRVRRADSVTAEDEHLISVDCSCVAESGRRRLSLIVDLKSRHVPVKRPI